MLFNSFRFLFVFFPLTLFVATRLKGQALLRWITLASFFFYALAGHLWFLAPMLVTTVLDFWLAPKIAEAPSAKVKKLYLWVSLCGNLGLLFYFKYGRFFFVSAQGAVLSIAHVLDLPAPDPRWLSIFDVVLPAGISFYTFQTVSYIIDVYRGEVPPERNFWKFAGFVSFFPHLVAGPLTRHHQLIPALGRIAESGVVPRWHAGLFLFVIGLSKKVLVADTIARHITPWIDGASPMGFSTAWIALVGYALQIYFDFSGYSDMAIGLGRLFGIELPKNFNSPYQAVSPSDFWQRWHMTLSAWLRDYVYIMLGGNRCSPRRRYSNVMVTMLLGGLWHGASWTFAAWGFYHGLLLVGFHAFERAWSAWGSSYRRALTFLAVCLGWVLFRSSSFEQANRWFASLSGLRGAGLDGFGGQKAFALTFIVACLIAVNTLPNAAHHEDWEDLPRSMHVALGLLSVAAILFMKSSSQFLYFQF